MSGPWWELEEVAATLLAGAGRQLLFSTLVFLGVLPVNKWLLHRWPRSTAMLRSALWGLVLVRLFLPPGLAVTGSAGDLWGRLGRAFQTSSPAASDAALVAEVEMAPRRLAAGSATALPWALSLLGAWAGGTAISGSLWWRRRLTARRLAAAGTPIEDGTVLAIAGEWLGRLGLARSVRFVAVERAVTPFTFGTRSPVVVLPRTLLAGPDHWLLESTVAHELVHVRRRDDLRLLLLQVLRSIWFFHPVVGWVQRRLADERERLTDGEVLAQGMIPPNAYGRSLLQVSRLTVSRFHREDRASVPALLHPQRSLPMRIHEILREGSSPSPRPASAVILACVAGFFLLPMAPVPAAGAAGLSAGDVPSAAAAADLPAWGVPVPGARVSSPYGERVDPMGGEIQIHRGIDLAAPHGSRIVAPAAGVVRTATTDYEGGSHHGTVVVVDHGGGLSSFYSHLDRLDVAPGQSVRSGELLGTVGLTGISTGAHLHFEVWRDGSQMDPAELVAAWRRP